MISKLLKFIYFLTPCICVLIGLEIILRFTNLSPYQVPVYPYDYFEKNDIYGYDIKKDQKRKKFSLDEYSFTVWGNEIGCFDYPINNLKDGYILLVGASVTWGFVPLKYNYGTVLENKLNKLNKYLYLKYKYICTPRTICFQRITLLSDEIYYSAIGTLP